MDSIGLRALAMATFALALGGCASSVPKATFTHEIATEARIGANDQADVKVDAEQGVEILDAERSRIAEKIRRRVDARKVANTGGTTGRNCEVDLHLTRYDKGNAFARALLAGLGQIHIDGTVSVYQMPEHNLIGEFLLNKTFAWGGIYGASTSIEDIENTFTDGVAANVTGQKEDAPKDKK